MVDSVYGPYAPAEELIGPRSITPIPSMVACAIAGSDPKPIATPSPVASVSVPLMSGPLPPLLRDQDFLGPHFGFADRQAHMVSVDVMPVGKYSRDARRVDVQNLVGVF